MMKDQEGPVEGAVALARIAHRGQVDKGGQPCIDHPLRVMETVHAEGPVAMVAAVLHDVVENAMENDRERLTRLLDQYNRPSCRIEAGTEWPEIRRALEVEAARLGLRVPWRAQAGVARNLVACGGRKSR